MPEQLSEDLVQFRTIILSLVSYAMHPRLDTLIGKLAPEQTPSKRFLIKLEIKRLAKPCPYVLDLRNYFEQCEAVQYQNICHYLDEISKTLFLDNIEKNNGLYSIHIYNEVNEQAKKRHLAMVKTKDIAKQNSKIDIDPIKVFSLVNDNICRDQAANTQSQCKVFTYDPLGMSRKGKEEIGVSVNVIDLNTQNCVIKTSLQVIDCEVKVIFLWFYDHHRLLGFDEEIVLQYSIEEFKESQSKNCSHYRLKLNKISDAKMFGHLTGLLNKRLQVNQDLQNNQIQPLHDSIIAKSHEQFLLTKTYDIAMVCAQYQTGWRPSCGLQTDSNQALWDFFLEGENHGPLTRLFDHVEIQNVLNKQDDFDQYAYVLRHSYQQQDQEKEQFVVIWQKQLEHDSAAKSLLTRYILTGDYRYIRLRLLPINAQQDAHVPAAVPSYVSPAMTLLNRPLGNQVTSLLKACEYLAILSDVTEINQILALPKVLGVRNKTQLVGEPIKCPIKYRLPVLKRKSPMEIVRVEVNDFRAEDRFDYAINVKMTRCGNKPCDISGVTNNISTQGLSIALDHPLKFKTGVDVRLTMEIPYRGKTISLANQVYQLIGGNDHQSLRLVISNSETRHPASQMLREFIYQNMDGLKASGLTDQQTYGLQRAMRNIYANNHTSVPFFIHQDKRQWFINSIAMNEYSVFDSLNVDGIPAQEMLIKLVQQEKFRNYCLSVINKVDKSNQVEVFYIIALPRNTRDKNKQIFWFNDLKQIQQANRLTEVMEKVRMLGQPTILRVQLSKPSRVMDKYFREELQYLEQISSRAATDVTTTLEQISGIGEITDHTEQILALFDHWIEKKEPVTLANAS